MKTSPIFPRVLRFILVLGVLAVVTLSAGAQSIIKLDLFPNKSDGTFGDSPEGWIPLNYELATGNYNVRFRDIGEFTSTFSTDLGDLTFAVARSSNNWVGGHYWASTGVTGYGLFTLETSTAFTLGGFQMGDSVLVYAVMAGPQGSINIGERAPNVTIGSETATALYIDPVNYQVPALENCTQINYIPYVIGEDGILHGTFGSPTAGSEVRLGGLIFVVTPIPEPTTWAALLLGLGMLGLLQKRRVA